ncbi:MAG: efflux RND transporter periplasmic adaptor subunit [Planctomycetota bacterium]
MKTHLRRAFILLLFALLVLALLKFQGKIFRPEHDTHAVPALAQVPPGAKTAKAMLAVLPESRTYPGFVEAGDPAQISSRVMATVLEVAAREGDQVAAGQSLIQLDDKAAQTRLAQAMANLQTAQANSLQAKLAFDRAERLRAAEALTAQEWESARAQRDATQAMEDQASDAVEEARTALEWYSLQAPFSGLVLRRSTDPGSLASPGQPLLFLYRPDRLRFAAAVPEELAARLQVGQSLEVSFPDKARNATLTRILPAADPRTGTVTLHLELAGGQNLLPGMLGRLEVLVGERETLVVPAAAVRQVGQLQRVQLVQDGRLAPTTITTGKSHDGRIEILTGLEAGEEVLIP